MTGSSGPEGFVRGLILVEEMRLRDLTIPKPHQAEVATLIGPTGPAARRGRDGDRLGLAGEDVDDLGVERPVAQLSEEAEVFEDASCPRWPPEMSGEPGTYHRASFERRAEIVGTSFRSKVS
jgi:hypothetical protein